MYQELSPADAQNLLHSEEVFLLDVRTHFEFTAAHLPNAVNIPIQFLEMSLDEIPNEIPILVYCMHGVRSAKASAFLLENGFKKVSHIQGGLHAMQMDGLA